MEVRILPDPLTLNPMNEHVMESNQTPVASSCPKTEDPHAAFLTALTLLADKADELEDLLDSPLYENMPVLSASLVCKIEGLNLAKHIINQHLLQLTAVSS